MEKKSYDLEKITVLFSIILALLFIILLLASYYVDSSVIRTICGALANILIPILIFNLLYEYLTRKFTSQSTSKMVAQTLMGNKEIISSFDKKVRKGFIRSTLQTMLNETKTNILNSIIDQYVDNECNVKSQFDYDISVKPLDENVYPFLDSKKYFMIIESLRYTKIYNKDELSKKSVNVVFTFDENSLDDFFKIKNVIFRENLCLDKQDIDQIITMFSSSDKEDIAKRLLSLNLEINGETLKPDDIELITNSNNAVAIKFNYIHPDISDESDEAKLNGISVDYKFVFRMPQLKCKNNFLVVLSEPTFKPCIRFSYIKSEMSSIRVIPFLDETNNSLNLSSEYQKGLLDYIKIDFNNWLIPRSGIVFTWENKM